MGEKDIQGKRLEDMMDFLQSFSRDGRYAAAKPELAAMKEKGEDITMCILLDYAENKGVKRGLDEGIRALIEASREFGQSYDVTAEKVMEKFQLDSVQTSERMRKYWGN